MAVAPTGGATGSFSSAIVTSSPNLLCVPLAAGVTCVWLGNAFVGEQASFIAVATASPDANGVFNLTTAWVGADLMGGPVAGADVTVGEPPTTPPTTTAAATTSPSTPSTTGAIAPTSAAFVTERGTLPATGAETSWLLYVGLGLLAVGAMALALAAGAWFRRAQD